MLLYIIAPDLSNYDNITYIILYYWAVLNSTRVILAKLPGRHGKCHNIDV